MAVARKRKNGTPNGSTLSKRQMKRKPINLDHLKVIEPLTDNQTKAFTAFKEGKNLCLHGVAGTGKTFLYTKMLRHVRGSGKIALAVSMSSPVAKWQAIVPWSSLRQISHNPPAALHRKYMARRG